MSKTWLFIIGFLSACIAILNAMYLGIEAGKYTLTLFEYVLFAIAITAHMTICVLCFYQDGYTDGHSVGFRDAVHDIKSEVDKGLIILQRREPDANTPQ